jgi:predicted glycosyltransferase
MGILDTIEELTRMGFEVKIKAREKDFYSIATRGFDGAYESYGSNGTTMGESLESLLDTVRGLAPFIEKDAKA